NISAVLHHGDSNRLVEVQWATQKEETYPVSIQVVAYDRAGLLRDFSNLVADEKINMVFVEAVTGQKDNLAQINATLEIFDVSQLTRILTKIDRLPNVVESRRRV
ncbi:MAG: bifunctional (p)ppGpp synthetase/guanosine-3',5'-bis(diphosphate) 3'-pyrophosphohydrolase, partial [Caldilineaceae bacterium]|nr:bifunctional (p)ppGpp synthetase/guanosine-3',5'-bis(diphosphate) 3'-pyrophosphohydrolase [Caldilineaceae bacterium]